MAGYRLTATADLRISDIFAYSFQTFGRQQARAYFSGLHDAFATLVLHPELGARFGEHAPTRRYVYGRHSIFYRTDAAGILILDLLGAGQDPERHLRES